MKFAIRDDDTNYFTNPRELEFVYKDIWDICPISISIIPFHACTKSGAIPKKYWRGNVIFPIGKNTELIEFLKNKLREQKMSIMLHGYNHKDNPDGYEFGTGKNLYKKVKEGKRYLEKIFDIEIKILVPPHNSISKEGLNAVIKNNLNIVIIPSFRLRKRTFNYINIIPFFKQRYYHLRFKRSYPYVLRFQDHSEIACHGLIPETTLDSIIDDFNFYYERNGDFCLATHYWELFQNIEMMKTFRKFWEHISDKKRIRFRKVDEIIREKA